MTLSEIEQIRARHHNAGPNLEGEHYCEDCWGRDAYWPCDASLLLAALSGLLVARSELQAENENLRNGHHLDVRYLERALETAEQERNDLQAALSDAEAELRKYGMHKVGCAREWEFDPTSEPGTVTVRSTGCDCGFDVREHTEPHSPPPPDRYSFEVGW